MLRSRLSINMPLIVIIAVIAVLGALSASAGGDRLVSLRFAGDFIQNLEQTDVDEFGIPVGTSNLGLIRGKVKGNYPGTGLERPRL